ncbi:hypothetical protein DSL92_06405 [Billgrantia gudaonensis]|uniref:Uncharacterized protein n=1 Tax=Billgrantia gudaonensis TaxID=376427 RepID=A0A432JIM1_9GAMM|nr:hypothetical protein DSL92_06405 [Halomonas gudaonensis]
MLLLFQHASIALNHAKRGGSRTRFQQCHGRGHARERLQSRFIEALHHERLTRFQPQFSLEAAS